MTDLDEKLHHFILTVMAPDRVGLVEEVTQFLFERNCNIEDSRMSVLGGEFVMAILANGTKEGVKNVYHELNQLEENSNLHTLFKETQSAEERSRRDCLPYRVRATSLDHPGIVSKVSHILREHGVNIERADAEQQGAPFGGSPLFVLDMEIGVPTEVPISHLRKHLTELGEEMNMDIDIHPMTEI